MTEAVLFQQQTKKSLNDYYLPAKYGSLDVVKKPNSRFQQALQRNKGSLNFK